ncbi:MAG: rhomboid family intramembrane serine protease [Prevotellaceae bacterium]|jgi:membrane associated rhomboid family serine protease|nr:rhomboid family intramembrane serine protease [Prevotellaceae bacterium]
MNPYTLLTLVTVGLSILAFKNRELLNKLMLYPYIMARQRNQWYRIITHAFIHADWMHLIFNMIALWSFGAFVFNSLENMTSSPALHFFAMYFGAILFSSISDVTKQKNNQHYASLGASGAVSAVIFFSILLNPWTFIYVFFIPCPGIVFGVLYLVYSNYMSKRGGDIINHDAHFYGAIFGILYPLFVKTGIYKHFLDKLLHPNFL